MPVAESCKTNVPPIVTLTTDFGALDSYVGEIKGALLQHCPFASIVDITHAVIRHDIFSASIILERTINAFPPGTIHVAVVDPGVGTDRRLLCVQCSGQIVLCPDNGLITWPWRRQGGGIARELLWRPAKSSHVFHGRDIIAPAAGMIAAGVARETLEGPPIEPALLDIFMAQSLTDGCQIIHIDHFGNAMTNIPETLLEPRLAFEVQVAGRTIGPISRTYGDVAEGQPLALIGSSGLVEIAVRGGSAAEVLGLKRGDLLSIRMRD